VSFKAMMFFEKSENPIMKVHISPRRNLPTL